MHGKEKEKPIRAAGHGMAAHTHRSWLKEEVWQWSGCAQHLGLVWKSPSCRPRDALVPSGAVPPFPFSTGSAAQSKLL